MTLSVSVSYVSGNAEVLEFNLKAGPQSGISTAEERNDGELSEITVSEPLLC